MAKTKEDKEHEGLMLIMCEGCGVRHMIATKHPEIWTHNWGFNGDLEAPSFTPSVKIRWPEWIGGEAFEEFTTFETACRTTKDPSKWKIHCCHFVITRGVIAFQGDCTHELMNHNRQLPNIE